MDNYTNLTSPFTMDEVDFWQGFPIPTEPFMEHHDVQAIVISTSPLLCMSRGQGEKSVLASHPTPSPGILLAAAAQPKPLLPAPSSNPSPNAALEPLVTTTISCKPPKKARTSNRVQSGKETKKMDPPKYKINPDDCATEEEKKSVEHAIKCRKGRIQKAQEREKLLQNNAQLTNQVRILEERLRVARQKTEELQQEVDRRGQVILAMSLHSTLS